MSHESKARNEESRISLNGIKVETWKDSRQAVSYLEKYVSTYSSQQGYEGYPPSIFIDDVLYGLGVSIYGPSAEWHGGYQEFKVKLMEYLLQTTPKCKELLSGFQMDEEVKHETKQ